METETKNPLGLDTPQLSEPGKDSFDTRPKKVEQWIESLPMMNIGETARQIYKGITDVNQLRVPQLNRMQVIDQFRTPVNFLGTSLCKHFVDAPFPLPPKSLKVANLCKELQSQMAMGYKLVVADIVSGKISRSDQKLLVIAIHRTLQYCSQMLLQSILVYDRTPSNFWRELHRIYMFAERNGIHAIPVKIGDSEPTIADLYKQIALLSIASTTNLGQQDIKLVAAQIMNWTASVEMSKPNDRDNNNATFIINLGSDKPPTYTLLYTREKTNLCRLLITKPLITQLHSQLKNPKSTNKTLFGNLDRNIIVRLIYVWNGMRKRIYPRTPSDFDQEVAVGLADIYANLYHEPELIISSSAEVEDDDWLERTVKPKPNMEPSLFEEASLSLLPIGSDYGSNAKALNPWSTQTPANSKNNTTTALENPEGVTFPCRTINASAGGYSLLWYSNNPPKIRIGELLGIRKEDDPEVFGVGILRWLKNIPSKGIAFGIQVLSQTAVAATIWPTDGKSEHHIALLLPENKKMNTAASVLVESPIFRKGSTVFIDDSNTKIKARLTQQQESSRSFNQFAYVVLETKNLRQTNQINEPLQEIGENDDFDSVWSLL